ncbi:hypothetical protein MC885_007087, partial [Smutsia gigantea]
DPTLPSPMPAKIQTEKPKAREGPGPQELPPQEAVSFHPDDEDSSDLNMEQLLEEVGKELEQRE